MSLSVSLNNAALFVIESHENNERIQLLAPLPAFWENFTKSHEYVDGKIDPLDRYSKRVINPIAEEYDLQASFPSDGPPYPAFISWALNSNEIHISPLGLLVHNGFGLFISFRGALIGGKPINTHTSISPCDGCAAPCKTACPVNAFVDGQYDVPKCKEYLNSGDVECWQGCIARKSCPAASIRRDTDQSQFHMNAFMS